MGPYLRTTAITAAVMTPLTVGYSLASFRDETGWQQLGAFAGETVFVGGSGIVSLAAAGVLALRPSWRGAAKVAAGIGTALLASTAAGVGTIAVGSRWSS